MVSGGSGQPNDNTMRASTLPGTVSPLRFSTILVVEIVFNEESSDPQHDGKVKIATLFEKEVHISSCCCWLPYLALPTYSPDTPEETRFKWHINGWSVSSLARHFLLRITTDLSKKSATASAACATSCESCGLDRA